MTCKQSNSSALVCYGSFNPDAVRGYKYVIVESEHFSAFDVKILRKNNSLVLGYISLGEVSDQRYYYEEIKDRTLGKNPIWDSYFLDLNDPKTIRVLLDLVDRMVNKGFNGLFLDTIDVYGKWGSQSESKQALISFLRLLSEKYPDLHLMQNSGLSVADESYRYIQSLALESVITDYDFDKKKYRMRTKQGVNERVQMLESFQKEYNKPVLLIEYAASKSMIKKVQEKVLNKDWDYFIGKIDLSELPE